MDAIRKYKFGENVNVDFLKLYVAAKAMLLEDYPEYVGNISDENEDYKEDMCSYVTDGLYGELGSGEVTNNFFSYATGTTNYPYYNTDNENVVFNITEDFEDWLYETGVDVIEKELASSDITINDNNPMAEISW